jgi:hypothetical protein
MSAEQENTAPAVEISAPRDRVIFVDIDYTLNTEDDFRAFSERNTTGLPWVLSETCIDNLNAICAAVLHPRVVLSSTWRLYDRWQTPGELTAFFRAHGYTGPEITDATPDLSREFNGIFLSSTRADEIRTWLETHADTAYSYVILDDLQGADTEKNRWIKTFSDKGLVASDVLVAVQCLERPMAGE